MADRTEALRGLRNLKVLLGTDSPEVRGWAPAVQQAAQRAVNAAIRALGDAEGEPPPMRSPIPVERLRAMRSEARASDECEREHWFILFARAIERAHGVAVLGAKTAPAEDADGPSLEDINAARDLLRLGPLKGTA